MAVDDEIQLGRLARSFAAVGELIDAIQPGQWSAPTQCLDWTVHRLVEHLVGKNLVFAAVLAGQPLPRRGDGVPSDQLTPPIANRLPCCSTRLGSATGTVVSRTRILTGLAGRLSRGCWIDRE